MSPPERFTASSVDASVLGQPLHLPFSGKVAPNRFLKAAMTERAATWDPQTASTRGVPGTELETLYKHWGDGGYGFILTGNIQISPHDLEAAGNMIIARDMPFEGERFEAFKTLATAAKRGGGLIIGQVSHPGRQVFEKLQPHPVSASDVQLQANFAGMTFGKPRAATEEDIKGFVDGFAHAAEYLERAGFDGIQLHGAHGYLLAQFLSQTTNLRTDQYGGSLANRARIVTEIAAEIKKRTKPSFSLNIKLNSVEFQDKGLQPEDAKEVCKILESSGFDSVELSGGTYEQLAFDHKRESTKKREAFFMEWADLIAPAMKKTKVYVTGGFHTVDAMVKALQTVDGVGLGRVAAQEPRFVHDVLSGKVSSAIKQKIPQEDTFMRLQVAGTQMDQISQNMEPIDLSVEENANAFLKDLATWGEKMAKDAEGKEQHYPAILSAQQLPYGTSL